MQQGLHERFASQWQSLANDLGLDRQASAETYNYLHAQYSGDDRHYHSIRHIVSMLDGFEAIKDKFQYPDSARLAIFFHDVIYNPLSKTNEADSATAMKAMLGSNLDSGLLERAAFSIEATSKHAPTPDPDTNLVIDLDMAILGQPWAVYSRYASGTMKEYTAAGAFTEQQYRQGRVALFLEPTLGKERIFITDTFARLDAQARKNMAQEINIMQTGQSFGSQAIG